MKYEIKELYESEYKDDLIKLLSKSLNFDVSDTLNFLINVKNYPDKNIYLFLHNLYLKQSKKYDPITASKDRAIKTAKTIKSFFPYVHYTNVNNYLDIGCEDCNIPIEVGKIFSAKNVYCINIEDWESTYQLTVTANYSNKKCNFQFYDGVNIPFGDNFFNVCTILMVIHHVEKLEQLIKDVHRVLVKNGYLIIKEHDANSEGLKKLIEVQHYIYDTIYFGRYIENYKVDYLSMEDLKKILIKNGFKFIKIKRLNNITKSYYAVYKRI